MTTLELAEAIARAVLREVDAGEWALLPHDEYFRVEPDGFKCQDLQVAVLRVLRENDSWFCRVSDPEDGVTVETPHEQVELFR